PALLAALALACLAAAMTTGPVAAAGLFPAAGSLMGVRHSADDQATQAEPPPPHRSDHLFTVCPVDPPRHYTDDFGDARYAGGFHRHQGIDIFAQRGTPVRAPF